MIMIDIPVLRPQIEGICLELAVKRLGLFGSALSKDFCPESDVDVLVMFNEDSKTDLFARYFELKERLEKVFGQDVDLVVDRPFRNPFFKDSVEKTRTVIYES
jgi:uncharacterized protein